jgi:hypothetical protein
MEEGGGRRWSATSLRISSSSTEEVLNISRHDAAMMQRRRFLGKESENGNGDDSKNGDGSKNGGEI